jgi:hypothetical protein
MYEYRFYVWLLSLLSLAAFASIILKWWLTP